jgi:hypothetical protein
MLKNLQFASFDTALASIVLPFPGGPNNKRPFIGARKPVNRLGFKAGRITSSFKACLAFS